MINKLQFSIEIEAERETIWSVLWNKDSYRTWASVFFEGSYFVADNLEEGNRVLFLSPDKSGIYSVIEKHIPGQIILFRHIGTVVEGEEQPIEEETKKWSGATEVYTLTEENKNYLLTVKIDVLDEHLEFMTTTLPKALEKIKSMCEKT